MVGLTFFVFCILTVLSLSRCSTLPLANIMQQTPLQAFRTQDSFENFKKVSSTFCKSIRTTLAYKYHTPFKSVMDGNLQQQVSQSILRIPLAMKEATKSSIEAFFSTAVIIVPVGLLLNSGLLFNGGAKAWISKGSKMGFDWGKISAIYAGGEKMFQHLRDKNDRWNAYMGSGLASACLRFEEGPLGMLQGFVVGFGFLYLCEKYLGTLKPPATTPQVTSVPPSTK